MKYRTFNLSFCLSLICLFACMLFAGCAGARVSSSSRSATAIPSGKIGLAPGGGVLGDAVGVELFQRGYDIVESTQVKQIVARVNMAEADISSQQGLEQLRKEGIQTLLMVRAAGGLDNLPQSATVRVVNTGTGSTMAAVNWQNGHGGMAGSMMDRAMRDDVVAAAQKIADELSKSLTK